jgi:flagella basal body P-ring formation protein FlgA
VKVLNIAAALWLAFAASALASQPVALKAEVGMQGGRVTLGDLFDGAGAAAPVVAASGAAPGSNLVLDAGRVQMLARSHGLDWTNERGVRRIIARANLTSAPAPLAAARVSSTTRAPARRGRALAYARDMTAGEIVRAQDLVWASSDVGVPLDAPHDADQVIGMAARRPLRQGAAVHLNDVAAPVVIKRGDMVQVSYAADGITLVLQAKAMSDATTGETVNVVNPASRKIVQAVAFGPGAAVVGPQAERLKSAGSDPQLIASIR